MGGRILSVVGKSMEHYATIMAFNSLGTTSQARKKMHVIVLVASTTKPKKFTVTAILNILRPPKSTYTANTF